MNTSDVEHDAIQTFMGNYARCMGTIAAIRVLKDAPEGDGSEDWRLE